MGMRISRLLGGALRSRSPAGRSILDRNAFQWLAERDQTAGQRTLLLILGVAAAGVLSAWLLSFVVLVVLGTYHHMISFNQWY